MSTPSQHGGSTPARPRVLVVDDEPLLGRTLLRVLRGGHDVDVTTSAREALALLAEGKRYDVIFCDLLMPGQTGMDFHAALTDVEPGLCARVVFITGGAFTDEAAAFLERVPNRRLTKPFEASAVRAAVAAMVDPARP